MGVEVKGKTKGANRLISTKPKDAGAVRRLVIWLLEELGVQKVQCLGSNMALFT